MKIGTLIELYDERPLENVLGVEMFRPGKVIYICADGFSARRRYSARLKAYFAHRGIEIGISFVSADVYDTEALLSLFRRVLRENPGAAMDITGGTDAVLFAAGLACAEIDVPVITYSRMSNSFYSIRNASFADGLACNIVFTVQDCFMMAGGVMRRGRVDNAVLDRYTADIDPFFGVFMKYRSRWDRIVAYIQKISPAAPDGSYTLKAEGAGVVKGDRGSRLEAPEDALRDLTEIGMISDLSIVSGESVAFTFRDGQIRAWLRDVGSVLELYIYKACLDTGLFDDVRTSAVVDWDGDDKNPAVSNELDVMCTRGITPVFISCKTCAVKTEALNELSVLRDRFGGKIARAALVTAEPAGAAARNRAADLNIRIIDLNDLESGAAGQRIRELMA